MSPPSEPGSRRGRLALGIAWLLVLGLLAASGGVILAERLKSPAPVLSVAIPDKVEPEQGNAAGRPAPPAQAGTAPQAPREAAKAPSQSAETPVEATPENTNGKTESVEAAPTETAAPARLEDSGPPNGTETRPQPSEEEPGQASPSAVAQTEAPEPDPASSETSPSQAPAPQADAGETEDVPPASPAPAPIASDGTGPDPSEEQSAKLDLPAWQRYGTKGGSEPGREAARPQIAVVVTGLGQSAAATEAAIRQLPPGITLSFSPYARQLNQWIALARVNKHEVLIDLPMEPLTFPDDDPGPHALLTLLDSGENLRRLDWLLQRGNSYVGVTALMGSRFTASAPHLRPIFSSLKERGLLYLDNGASAESAVPEVARQFSLPLVLSDRMLDLTQASRVAINARLTELERLALENDFAVAIGQPYPVTIERLVEWSAAVASRGFDLVPITALVDRKRRPQAVVETKPSGNREAN